jgi:hypothetical protein
MKRKTKGNINKAVDIIMAKGYDFIIANDIVLQCFENMNQSNNGMPLEWWLDKIIPAENYNREYGM